MIDPTLLRAGEAAGAPAAGKNRNRSGVTSSRLPGTAKPPHRAAERATSEPSPLRCRSPTSRAYAFSGVGPRGGGRAHVRSSARTASSPPSDAASLDGPPVDPLAASAEKTAGGPRRTFTWCSATARAKLASSRRRRPRADRAARTASQESREEQAQPARAAIEDAPTGARGALVRSSGCSGSRERRGPANRPSSRPRPRSSHAPWPCSPSAAPRRSRRGPGRPRSASRPRVPNAVRPTPRARRSMSVAMSVCSARNWRAFSALAELVALVGEPGALFLTISRSTPTSRRLPSWRCRART